MSGCFREINVLRPPHNSICIKLASKSTGCNMFNLTELQVKHTSTVNEQPTMLWIAWVAAPSANHNQCCGGSLKLLLMAFVWRRGGVGSVRLLISNKQKVTSLKFWSIWALEGLWDDETGLNYVGCLAGACWLAFKEDPAAVSNVWRCSMDTTSLLGRSKWRCWADSCVIMLLPTRVGNKKSQVNARGEAACRHPALEATPVPWNRWKTDCRWMVGGEACCTWSLLWRLYITCLGVVGAIFAGLHLLFTLGWRVKICCWCCLIAKLVRYMTKCVPKHEVLTRIYT